MKQAAGGAAARRKTAKTVRKPAVTGKITIRSTNIQSKKAAVKPSAAKKTAVSTKKTLVAGKKSPKIAVFEKKNAKMDHKTAHKTITTQKTAVKLGQKTSTSTKSVPKTENKPTTLKQSASPLGRAPLFPVPGAEKAVVPQGPRRPLIVFPK